MCGGYEAGRQAGMKASGMETAGALDEDAISAAKESIFAPLGNQSDDRIDYHEIEQATRNVMNYYMGFRRSTAGMERALEKIRFLKTQVPRLGADSLRELMRCHESQDILKVCDLAIQATLERKESGRCVYRVREFPNLNPEMAKPLLLRKGPEGTIFHWGKESLFANA